MSERDKLSDLEKDRLRWQCRRGMLELDLLLGGFLESGYGKLSLDEQRAFVELLGEPDQRLSDWFMGRAAPADPRLRALIEHIIAETVETARRD